MIETVAVIRKNDRQEFRVEIFSPERMAPMVRLRLFEDHGSGERRPRPGTPGIPSALVVSVTEGLLAAQRRLETA